MADHARSPIAEHIDAYYDHLRAKAVSPKRLILTKQQLARLAAECKWTRISDLTRAGLESWMVNASLEDMAAGTRNGYLSNARAFGNRWRPGAR